MADIYHLSDWPKRKPETEVQTRTMEGEIILYANLVDALVGAQLNPLIWKISYQAYQGSHRHRFIRAIDGGSEFIEAHIFSNEEES